MNFKISGNRFEKTVSKKSRSDGFPVLNSPPLVPDLKTRHKGAIFSAIMQHLANFIN